MFVIKSLISKSTSINHHLGQFVNSLGLNVIAEGVENEQQQQYLLSEGCNHFQGYLFSKPVPIDHFEKLLSQTISA